MRVLIVEDDARLADFLQRGLREQSFETHTVADGENALLAETASAFDAIVLDVALPRMDGFEVLQALRRRGSTAPVLMLTARDAVSDKLTGFRSGADDYVTKPFDFDELVLRLRALLRRSTGNPANVIEIGDLLIDRRARSLTRAGVPIRLTSTEYELLDYLAQNRDRLISKPELSREVWGQEFDPTSNLIGVYVARLRKKIDAGREQRLLRSRRGEGYRLTADASSEEDDDGTE